MRACVSDGAGWLTPTTFAVNPVAATVVKRTTGARRRVVEREVIRMLSIWEWEARGTCTVLPPGDCTDELVAKPQLSGREFDASAG